MSQVLPFSPELSNFSQQLTLDNQLFIFRFVWNWRAEQWNILISDINGVQLADGIKIVLNYPLFNQWVDRGLPPGDLVAIDTTGEVLKITRDNLGDVVQLVYIPEAEL